MTIAFVHLPEANRDVNLAHVAYIERGAWPELTLTTTDSSEDGHPTALVLALSATDLAAFDAALRTFRVNNHVAPMPEVAQ